MSGGGAPSDPVLTALWTTDPAAAAARVRVALETSKSVTRAARKLNIPARTLYRWIRTKPSLTLRDKDMTPREVRGAINRAKVVYAIVCWNPRNTFFVRLSKEAARELCDAANGETAVEDKMMVAKEDKGNLYLGTVPASAPNAKARDEEE